MLASGWFDLGHANNLMRVLNPRAMVKKKTGSSALAAISGAPLDFAMKLLPIRKRTHKEHI
ncbi:hypothetical protein ACFLUF_03265 [Chloroflexota bacterium]